MMRYLFTFIFLIFTTSTAKAVWSVNAAYNNPPGAPFGLNLLADMVDWGAEIGFDYAKSGADDKGRTATLLAGSLNAKYFILSGSLRPYVQLGTGWGFSTTGASTHLGIGEHLYYGAGLFVMSSGLYTYASYNSGLGDPFFQLGIGFNL